MKKRLFVVFSFHELRIDWPVGFFPFHFHNIKAASSEYEKAVINLRVNWYANMQAYASIYRNLIFLTMDPKKFVY